MPRSNPPEAHESNGAYYGAAVSWTAPAERSGDGAFEGLMCIRHAAKRCRAALAAALHDVAIFRGTMGIVGSSQIPSRFIAKLILCVLLLATLGLFTGCQHVSPWERGALADPTMRTDHDVLGKMFAEHMWFSREAASGGAGVGGGGCGCN